MTTDRSGILVTVHDEGRGFSLGDIPRERRGIRSSIVSRMEGIGGHARILSSPGAGSTVELHWAPPARADGEVAGQGDAPSQGQERTNGANAHTTSQARVHIPTDTDTAPPVNTDVNAPDGVRNDAPTHVRTPSDRHRILWSTTVPTFMETRRARSLGLVALLCQGAVLALVAGTYTHLAPALLTFLAFGVMGSLLLRTWPDALIPTWLAASTALVVGIGNAAVLLTIPGAHWPGYAAWSAGAGTFLCLGLVIRLRARAAWSGIGLMLLSALVWCLTTGKSPSVALALVFGQAATVALWQLAARWSSSAGARILDAEDQRRELATQRHVQEESTRLMTDSLASVTARVRPLLERVASDAPLTELDGVEAGLVEAELRDELRAPFFTGTAVVGSARDARRRGVDVVLIDDGGRDIGPLIAERIVEEVVGFLRECSHGRAVVRILPPGRALLATLVSEDQHLAVDRRGDVHG
jgi:hypothetical protein